MISQQLWQAALGELELIISKANFTTWFKNTFIVAMEEGKIIIGVPNTFTKTWLEKKYHGAITKAIQNVSSEQIIEVIYTVEQKHLDNNTVSLPIPAIASPLVTESKQQATKGTGLNDKYRFETFVVGKGNELAHAAALAVANNPGQSYNPLFIYGGVGLGKTHLLQAIGITLHEKGNNIVYATSERFTSDYIQSVRAGRGKEFKDLYRNADVLLIDDIQFVAGKEGTQEELFHTFNALHQNNRQIILTSDRPPKAIPALEQRLLSRFEWGMIADISQPDLETRIAILQNKCKEHKFSLEREVVHYLATTFHQNVRELEGALVRIIAECQFRNLAPSLEIVKKLFTDNQLSANIRRTIAPRRLIELVCRYYDIPMNDLVGKSRKRELVVPRQVTMYLMREDGQASFPTIGQQIGDRDHTTAMHACEKIRDAIESDETIRHDILTLRQQLYTT